MYSESVESANKKSDTESTQHEEASALDVMAKLDELDAIAREKAKWAEMKRSRDAELNTLVSEKVGKETLENIERSSYEIGVAFKKLVLTTKEKDPGETENIVELLQRLSKSFIQRASTGKPGDSEKITNASNLAIAMMEKA